MKKISTFAASKSISHTHFSQNSSKTTSFYTKNGDFRKKIKYHNAIIGKRKAKNIFLQKSFFFIKKSRKMRKFSLFSRILQKTNRESPVGFLQCVDKVCLKNWLRHFAQSRNNTQRQIVKQVQHQKTLQKAKATPNIF